MSHRTSYRPGGRARALAALASSFACVAALAEPSAGVEPVLATDRIGDVLTGLFAVLGAILAAAWIGRRIMRIQPGASGQLRLVGGLSLGTRERIVLVQAGETQLLVGVAPGRIQTLHVLDAPLEIGSQAPAAPATPFARVLERIGERGGAGGRP